jgi:integrase/recombinase XerD
MQKKEKPFVGVFKNLLNDFIKHKRNLGYKYNTTRESLYRFSVFSENYIIKNQSLNKQLVLDWIFKRKNESIRTWENRKNYLRQFAVYLQNLGYNAFIPLKDQKIKRPEFIPYIFTHEEISKIFNIIDSIKSHSLSIKDKVFPLLFRLLYCCGLRISEALNLKISDFDFQKGVILIKESKFDKDRIIPVTESLLSLILKYHTLFNTKFNPDNYFFRNKNGTKLKHKRVYDLYRQILWKAGISHGGKGKGPRLHDFRHTFCVHTLTKQVAEGIDLYVALPILSKYIGHSSVGATQRYVRLTVEAYPDLIKKVSGKCSYIFPNGDDE